MTDDELRHRLHDTEDGWTERKPQNIDRSDARKALVAFANSVPEGEEAILFIGVADDGRPLGVENPDQTQRKVRQWAEGCYPEIRYTSRVIECEGKQVIAVIVRSDHNKPHFAGPAYIRIGSESVKASDKVFEELIASRMGKPRLLLDAKRRGELVSVAHYPRGFGDQIMRSILGDCTVIECTPIFASFQSNKTHQILSAEYTRMSISKTPDGRQLKVNIEG